MLTKKQQAIYEYLQQYAGQHGRAPSLNEIRAHFGLRSVATVHKHLKSIEERGAVVRKRNRARAMEVLPVQAWTSRSEVECLPVVDDFREPFPANIESFGTLQYVPSWMVQGAYDPADASVIPYLFQQKNDSLINLGVRVGDWFVLVLKPDYAELDSSAHLMAITVDNIGSIVRLVRREGKRFYVEAGRPGIKAFWLEANRVRLCGRVVGLLRSSLAFETPRPAAPEPGEA